MKTLGLRHTNVLETQCVDLHINRKYGFHKFSWNCVPLERESFCVFNAYQGLLWHCNLM